MGELLTQRKLNSFTQYLATKEDVANVKAEIIKWMFIFWTGQIAATIAIVKFIH